MKLKLDENGNAALSDGKPVYVHDDGREVARQHPRDLFDVRDLLANEVLGGGSVHDTGPFWSFNGAA